MFWSLSENIVFPPVAIVGEEIAFKPVSLARLEGCLADLTNRSCDLLPLASDIARQ